MTMPIDYTAYPVLYVDDDTANLVAVRYALDQIFDLLTASSGEEALRILAERDDIAILLCDQRMPGMTGVEVCEKARDLRPDAIRIIITAYADLHDAIDAINRGQISRYIRKPFRNEDLIELLRTGLELVHIQRTVHDLELRLLQAGQTSTARTIEADIGHELGNFLAALDMNVTASAEMARGALSNLESDASQARRLLEEMALIHEDSATAMQQLRSMVNRLKQGDVSFLRATCNVDRVVDSTVRILRSEIQQVARLQVVTEGAPRVPMEASVLGQVVMNLLLNAAQALGDQAPDEAQIVVRVATMGDRALLSVADSGPGIADEDVGRIFDPHFTTKEGGNGLGLSIVREMVTAVGGRVEVSTGDGRGTTFTIDLPLARGSTRPPPRP